MATTRGDPASLAFRVARRIAAKRRERNLSQEGFAALLGIAAKNVQRLEAGKQNLSLSTVERIARVLETTPEALLSDGPPVADGPALPPTLARLAAAGFAVRTPTEPGRRPKGATPVVTLRAAAGVVRGAARAPEVLGWVTLPRAAESGPPAGHFVSEVVGRSMEPRISSGSLCLFGPAAPPPYRGRIVLVAHGSLVDEATGAHYALKRIASVRKVDETRSRITLESINPEVPPVVLEIGGDDELRVVADLVRVLVLGT
jgi:transcriptional regulator with XRE-family HTH domain